MDSHVYDIQIRVLVYKEDGEFVARALELDLLGYGKNEHEAVVELRSAVKSQVTFAHQMKDETLLSCRADEGYFNRWEDANSKAMMSQIIGDKSLKLMAKATIIQVPIKQLKPVGSRLFKQASIPVCA